MTAPELPSELLIEALNVGPTELTIQWSGELPTDESLTWRIWLDFQQVAGLDSSTIEYTFESLVPLTSYTVQLSLVDEAGNESALSEPLVVQTGDDAAPLWPDGSQLEATNIKESTLTLTWPNATDADSIAQYLVSQDGEAIHTLNQDITTVEVTDLTPWTDNVIGVIAVDPTGLQSILWSSRYRPPTTRLRCGLKSRWSLLWTPAPSP